MTYQQILDRDVPAMVALSRRLAAEGIAGKMHVYYRREQLTGVFEHEGIETLDGWASTGVAIPCNIPWDQWNTYLRNRLGQCPLFA
jgi:hypothetical protein